MRSFLAHVASSVVSVLDTQLSCAETAELIEMLFRIQSRLSDKDAEDVHLLCKYRNFPETHENSLFLRRDWHYYAVRIICCKRHKMVKCPSVRLSVPSIDSSSGGRRVCC